jgi:hypothetical protein
MGLALDKLVLVAMMEKKIRVMGRRSGFIFFNWENIYLFILGVSKVYQFAQNLPKP